MPRKKVAVATQDDDGDDRVIPDMHPLDFSSIREGDYITPEQCDAALGCDSNDQYRHFKMMGLRELVEQQTDLITRQHKGGILILARGEAVAFMNQQNIVTGKALIKQRIRWNRVRLEGLSDEQVRSAEAGKKLAQAMADGVVNAASKRNKLAHMIKLLGHSEDAEE